MELEVAQHLGAEQYQRSPDRQGERNGYRDRNWDTRVGTLELRVPRVRDGSLFPGMPDAPASSIGPTRTCGSRRRSSKSGRTTVWSTWRWSSPSDSMRPPGSARCWAWTSDRVRTVLSGCASCARWWRVAWLTCNS